MAQYLMAVHGNEEEYAKVPADQWPEMFAAVDAYNKQLEADGVWVFGGGLQGAETATVVDAEGKAWFVDLEKATDGPGPHASAEPEAPADKGEGPRP